MLFRGRSRDGKKTLRALRDLSNRASGSGDLVVKAIVMAESMCLGMDGPDVAVRMAGEKKRLQIFAPRNQVRRLPGHVQG